jgi:hypothetical protein
MPAKPRGPRDRADRPEPALGSQHIGPYQENDILAIITISDRIEALRYHVAKITRLVRRLPVWKRRGPDFEAVIRERSRLLLEIDRLARPVPEAKPNAKLTARDRRRDEAMILALVEESEAETEATRTRRKRKAQPACVAAVRPR